MTSVYLISNFDANFLFLIPISPSFWFLVIHRPIVSCVSYPSIKITRNPIEGKGRFRWGYYSVWWLFWMHTKLLRKRRVSCSWHSSSIQFRSDLSSSLSFRHWSSYKLLFLSQRKPNGDDGLDRLRSLKPETSELISTAKSSRVDASFPKSNHLHVIPIELEQLELEQHEDSDDVRYQKDFHCTLEHGVD